MNRVLNLQMSLFGSFDSIGADVSLAAELIPLFDNSLIPSVIQLATIDPSNSALNISNRLSMMSPDGKYTVVFLPDRIDCNYSPKDEVISPETIQEKMKEMCTLITKAADKFSVVGNRVAINGRFVNSEITNNYEDYVIPNSFFAEKAVTEWGTKTNAVTTQNINGVEEQVNNILNLSLGKNGAGQCALIVDFDINTVPTNTTMRFRADSLHEFLVSALENMYTFTSQYR